MPSRRRLTIKEIAAAAGVSTQTVSRVLNNRPDVAPATLERIKQIIADTGYAPNMLARSLTQGHSRSFGVVAYGLEYFGPSRVLTGIERQAASMGYAISLNLIHDPQMNAVEPLLSDLFSRRVDGIIWAIPEVGANRDWLKPHDADFPVPLVLVGSPADPVLVPSIGIDNHAIGRLAAEHLLAGGARRVACVTGPLSWCEARDRQRGWFDTLREHGVCEVECPVVEGDWGAESGEQGLYRLLDARSDIDAVFAGNDQMALGVIHAAHRLGRRVPDDLSVVGVDDIAEASHFWPPLTTVHQPLVDLGALAVQVIEQAVKRTRAGRRGTESAPPKASLLSPELIVRESSRPVPAPASTR
jgi:LacI family transcriptional regulator